MTKRGNWGTWAVIDYQSQGRLDSESMSYMSRAQKEAMLGIGSKSEAKCTEPFWYRNRRPQIKKSSRQPQKQYPVNPSKKNTCKKKAQKQIKQSVPNPMLYKTCVHNWGSEHDKCKLYIYCIKKTCEQYRMKPVLYI